MTVDEKMALAAFDRLVAFYPRSFRDRVGESMRQTFRDLCGDRRSVNGRLALGFVIPALSEALVSVIGENLSEVSNVVMNRVVYRIAVSAFIGLIATVPFVAMEHVYSGGFPQGAPFAIFNVLWIDASLITYLAISLFRTPRVGSVTNWILPFILKSAALIAVISSWTFIVNDQMPCFLGGRGC
jgi:hypothetical protein